MDSQIEFSPKAIYQIANIMATQNSVDPNYMKGPELVSLFNVLGYPDAYTFSDGRGIQTVDYGEGLSRLTYVTKRLLDLNKVYQVPNAIQEFSKRAQQPSEFLNSVQKVLEPMGLLQQLPNVSTEPTLSENVNENSEINAVDDTKLVDDKISVIEKSNLKIYDERKKSLEESVLGEIPDGHRVVFISYSWDSPSHKEWVAKLAKDLADNGIYVLLDEYLEGGTTLSSFMELGIERAKKVLVIGTPNYREKCLGLSSGVAFEESIIRESMFQNLGTKKFIPCLRLGELTQSFPLILSGCKGYDFRKDDNYTTILDDLCRDIYGQPRRPRPKLGDVPDYAKQ